jgi:hypothetical protein
MKLRHERNFITEIFISIICLLSVVSHAEASGSGILTIGVTLPTDARELHTRQRVGLDRIGPLLVGRPQKGSVRILVLDAKNTEPAHLILRETDSPDGTKTIILSTPNSLVGKLVRGTIFMDGACGQDALAELEGGRWILRKPQKMLVSGSVRKRSGEEELFAFPISTLGPYRLLSRTAMETLFTSEGKEAFARTEQRKNYMQGFVNILISVLFLVIVRTLSRRAHADSRRIEDV